MLYIGVHVVHWSACCTLECIKRTRMISISLLLQKNRLSSLVHRWYLHKEYDGVKMMMMLVMMKKKKMKMNFHHIIFKI